VASHGGGLVVIDVVNRVGYAAVLRLGDVKVVGRVIGALKPDILEECVFFDGSEDLGL